MNWRRQRFYWGGWIVRHNWGDDEVAFFPSIISKKKKQNRISLCHMLSKDVNGYVFVFAHHFKGNNSLGTLLSTHRPLKAAMFALFNMFMYAFDTWRRDMKGDVSSIKAFWQSKLKWIEAFQHDWFASENRLSTSWVVMTLLSGCLCWRKRCTMEKPLQQADRAKVKVSISNQVEYLQVKCLTLVEQCLPSQIADIQNQQLQLIVSTLLGFYFLLSTIFGLLFLRIHKSNQPGIPLNATPCLTGMGQLFGSWPGHHIPTSFGRSLFFWVRSKWRKMTFFGSPKKRGLRSSGAEFRKFYGFTVLSIFV